MDGGEGGYLCGYIRDFQKRIYALPRYDCSKRLKTGDCLKLKEDIAFTLSAQEFIKPYEKKVCLVNISATPMYPLNIKFSIFRRLYCGIFSERKFFFINKLRKIIFIIKKLFSKRISLSMINLKICSSSVS